MDEVMSSQAKPLIAARLSDDSDRELVAACLGGNDSAWEALITRYKRLIYSIPAKARMSDDDAADVFQTVCLKLYQKLSTLRHEEKLGSWLITVTTRECWRVLAQQRREGVSLALSEDEDSNLAVDVQSAQPPIDEAQILFQQQQLVREGLAALSERCQKLLAMLFYHKDELSYSDISRRMNMPVSSIGSTRARCLENLRAKLRGKL
jgi:RNA polymerase sigma factor (sigma-70 family)